MAGDEVDRDFTNFKGEEVYHTDPVKQVQANYLPVHTAWFDALVKRHKTPKHMKAYGSLIRFWPDPDKGPMEMAKVLTTSQGKQDGTRSKSSLENHFDIEAIFNIIQNCKPFRSTFSDIEGGQLMSAISDALQARHICRHAVTTSLSPEEYKRVFTSLKKLIAIVNKNKYSNDRQIDARFFGDIDCGSGLSSYVNIQRMSD